MNTRNLFKSGFLRAALMLTLAVMTFPTKAWADNVNYIENGVQKSVDATPVSSLLFENENNGFPGGWYYVSGNNIHLAYPTFNSDTYIILCDNGVFGTSKVHVKGKLNIYGQSNGTGSLQIYRDYSVKSESSVTIYGGKVSGSIEGRSNITINGGEVTAYAIEGERITINGGQVTVTGNSHGDAIRSVDGVTLGWTNPTDFIKASKYYDYVQTAAGKRFVAYNDATGIAASCIIGDASSTTATPISEDISHDNATAAKTIAGKTLRPLDGYTVSTTDNKISLKNGTTEKNVDFTITTGTGTEADPTVTTSYYIYPANASTPTTITLDYNTPTGMMLTGYTVTKAGGGTVDVTKSGTYSFTMPDDDVTVSATLNTIIPSVAITGIDAPETQSPLATEATCTTTGVASSTVAWKKDGNFVSGNAEAGSTYEMIVTLTAADGYIFNASTEATLNGNVIIYRDVIVTSDGKGLTVSYTFPETIVTSTVSLAESAGDASDWSISPTGSIAAETNVTISYTGSIPEGCTIGGYIVKDADGGDVSVTETGGVFSFNMPAKNVTIYGVKYYMTNVPYMTWDATKKKLVEATTPNDTKVWVLTGGGATTLPGGWYVVNNHTEGVDAAYTGQLQFTGDAHLILCDGAAMTVGTSESPISAQDGAILGDRADINIYGQSTDAATMGSLTACGTYYGIDASRNKVIINGGRVIVTGKDQDGIFANYGLTINGGWVEATGGSDGMASPHGPVIINGGQVEATGGSNGNGIFTLSDEVTINGGQVTATGGTNGISANGDITFGWTNATDFIQASSYNVSGGNSVKIPQGKYLYKINDNSTTVWGKADTDEVFNVSEIAGKTLRPAMVIAGGDQKNLDVCLIDGNWKLIYGAMVYAVTGYDTATGTVTLSEAPLAGVPEGVPVVLVPYNDNTDITLTVASSKDEADRIRNSVPSNRSSLFIADDGVKTMAELIAAATGTSGATGDYMVFTLEDGVFRAASFSDDSVPAAGKCFLVVSKWDVFLMIRNGVNPPASGARGIPFDLGETTGISLTPSPSPKGDGSEYWYSLDGRKLDKAPTKKGVYIRSGVKVIIK